jgi:2-methylisocitrate lyase-like PEP mutase family enzyme
MWPFGRTKIFRLGRGTTLVGQGSYGKMPAILVQKAPIIGVPGTTYEGDIESLRRRTSRTGVIIVIESVAGARSLIEAAEQCIRRLEAKNTADRLLDKMEQGVHK